jgi:hypothetical protein
VRSLRHTAGTIWQHALRNYRNTNAPIAIAQQTVDVDKTINAPFALFMSHGASRCIISLQRLLSPLS